MILSQIFNKILKFIGKEYNLDNQIPFDLILLILIKRVVWLVRGLLLLRRKVFIAPGVEVSGKRFLKIGMYSTIEQNCRIDAYSKNNVIIGARTKIGAYSIISCTSHLSQLGKGFEIGQDCGIGEYCYFGSAGGIKIGNNVIMGQYVSFHSQNHNFKDPILPIRLQGVNSKGITIGSNVWIGAKVTILDGSVVDDNTIIAAGSVVKGIMPNNSIIGGIPAKIIREIY